MRTRVPIIRAAGDGDRRAFYGGGIHTWKLKAEDTGGDLLLFEDLLDAGKATPLHLHPDADEALYVLDGEILVNIDGTESRLSRGAMSLAPRGVPHAFLVLSDTARLLNIQTPGVGDAFYLGASEPTTGDTSTVDIALVQASARANGGVELLGPPPFAATAART
ncbi:MAG: hypothetical protein QOD30_473 [Actinomycetota bacterium]|jgi:quercetin dioxygenase-like cupin family protein|nr:hypothetical protein [Actinomycetota bacterium]